MAAPQHIYRLRPTRLEMLTKGPTAEEDRIISEHFEYLVLGAERGDVLFFGRTQTRDERTFGLAVLSITDENAARKFMDNDPAVKKGVMSAELFPFKVSGGCWARA